MVVETIEFEDDEDDELPMLLTQRDVVLMNKAGPLEEEDQEPAAALANGHAKEVEMSEEEQAMVAEANATANQAASGAVDGVQQPSAPADGQPVAAATAVAPAQVLLFLLYLSMLKLIKDIWCVSSKSVPHWLLVGNKCVATAFALHYRHCSLTWHAGAACTHCCSAAQCCARNPPLTCPASFVLVTATQSGQYAKGTMTV